MIQVKITGVGDFIEFLDKVKDPSEWRLEGSNEIKLTNKEEE